MMPTILLHPYYAEIQKISDGSFLVVIVIYKKIVSRILGKSVGKGMGPIVMSGVNICITVEPRLCEWGQWQAYIVMSGFSIYELYVLVDNVRKFSAIFRSLTIKALAREFL